MANHSWRYLGALLAAIAVVSATLSCTSGGGTPTPTPTPSAAPTATPTPAPVSFRTQVQPVFTANCSTSGCHTGATVGASGGLDLSEGVAFANIKDVTSPTYTPLKRVVSGDASQSLLFGKISNAGLINGKFIGDRMPLGRAALSASDITAIQLWITQGALNN